MKTKFNFLLVITGVFYLSACSGSKKINMTELISGKSWVVNSMMGKPLDMAQYAKGAPVLNFEPDGKLTGNSGCNNFNGKFSIDDNKLSIDPGAMTRMLCPGTGENDFLNAAKQVTGMKMEGQVLHLTNGAQEIMTLLPK